MTIQELIELHDGRTYETECNGTITLHLKKSWGKTRIEEEIENFEEEIAKNKRFRDWKLAIKSSLKVLHGYEVDDISGLWESWKRGTSIEEGTARIFRQLRRWETEAQIETIRELGWMDEKFTHIYTEENGNRLMKDCRSSKAFKIYPNGKYEIVRAVTYDWNSLRLVKIRLKHELSKTTVVAISGHWNYLNVNIYPFSDEKDPTWTAVMLTHSVKDDNSREWGKLGETNREHLEINSSTHRGNIDFIVRLHEAERLMLAIAQDFDNFLLNPVTWLDQVE